MSTEPISNQIHSRPNLDYRALSSDGVVPEIRSAPKLVVSVEPVEKDEPSFMQRVERASARALSGMSDLGAWWKGIKNRGQTEVETISTSTSIATASDGAYSSYLGGAGWKIAKADGISLKEGITRVPKALDGRSLFSKGMSKLGALVDATTGALDVMEALHDEGGKPGRKTMKTIAKTTAQVTLGSAAGSAIFAGVGALGLGIAGAPLVLGAVAAAGASYGIGKALDWWSGGQ